MEVEGLQTQGSVRDCLMAWLPPSPSTHVLPHVSNSMGSGVYEHHPNT